MVNYGPLLGAALLASTLTSALHAVTIDGISLIINKEPITLYDIHKYATRFKLSKKEALDLLVRQKLEDSEIKKLGIGVDSFEVEQYIDNLALSNGVNTFEFMEMLRSKNIDLAQYKEDLRIKLKREKLYKKIIGSKMQDLGDAELETYYKEHIQMFTQAQAFDVSIYTSASQEVLGKIAQNPMSAHEGVEVKESRFEASTIDPKLAHLLNQTPQGSFSPVVRSGESFVLFYIKAKHQEATLPFEQVRNNIYAQLAQKQEEGAIDSYFEKLKASANIQVMRAP